MPKKTIRMICYGPIACDPKWKSPWEDVWIRYFNGKHKVVKEAPCVASICDLYSDIKVSEEVQKDNPHLDMAKEMENLYRVKGELESGARFALYSLDMNSSRPPDIFVSEEWVDRKIVEEAVAWYLMQKGVLKSEPRFKWKKPSIVVTPVSVGC